jgi:hypothetical protein
LGGQFILFTAFTMAWCTASHVCRSPVSALDGFALYVAPPANTAPASELFEFGLKADADVEVFTVPGGGDEGKVFVVVFTCDFDGMKAVESDPRATANASGLTRVSVSTVPLPDILLENQTKADFGVGFVVGIRFGCPVRVFDLGSSPEAWATCILHWA